MAPPRRTPRADRRFALRGGTGMGVTVVGRSGPPWYEDVRPILGEVPEWSKGHAC